MKKYTLSLILATSLFAIGCNGDIKSEVASQVEKIGEVKDTAAKVLSEAKAKVEVKINEAKEVVTPETASKERLLMSFPHTHTLVDASTKQE